MAAAFDLWVMLDNFFGWGTGTIQRLFLIFGIGLLFFGVFGIVRNFLAQSHGPVGGPPPVKWGICFLSLFFGGVLLFGGLPTISGISQAGQDTLISMGQSEGAAGVDVSAKKDGTKLPTG